MIPSVTGHFLRQSESDNPNTGGLTGPMSQKDPRSETDSALASIVPVLKHPVIDGMAVLNSSQAAVPRLCPTACKVDARFN